MLLNWLRYFFDILKWNMPEKELVLHGVNLSANYLLQGLVYIFQQVLEEHLSLLAKEK
jgi:hypothetical protein